MAWRGGGVDAELLRSCRRGEGQGSSIGEGLTVVNREGEG